MNSKLLASLCSALGITLTMTGFAQQTKPHKSSDAASSQKMMNRGEPMSNGRMAGGYNAPSNVVLNRDWCGWFDSIEIDAAFTYWMATQGGMDLGRSASISTTTVTYTGDTEFLYQNFRFKPGFKVGIGGNYQDWTVNARYTWVNNHTHTSEDAPTAPSGTGIWVTTPWIEEASRSGDAGLAGAVNASSSWKLRMDLVDLVAGRPFYQGPAVTVNPFAGVRGAWIRQSLHQEWTPQSGANGVALLNSSPYVTRNFSHSWAVGPRMGGSGYCLMPMGFRFEGTLAANLLFTRYTKISHREPATVANTRGLNQHQNHINTVRPSVEAAMGLGWGMYMDNQRYHIDFAVDYEFQYYWNQNMIRSMLDTLWSSATPAAGDLQLQGLTVTGSFDF